MISTGFYLRLIFVYVNVARSWMPDAPATRAGLGPVPLQRRPSSCPKCGGQTRDNKPRGYYECKLKACGWIWRYRNPIEPMPTGPSSRIGQSWSKQDEKGVYRNFKCPRCGSAVRYQRLHPGPTIITCSNAHCTWTIDDLREERS